MTVKLKAVRTPDEFTTYEVEKLLRRIGQAIAHRSEAEIIVDTQRGTVSVKRGIETITFSLTTG